MLTCNAGAPSGEVRLDGILVGTLTPGTPANTARVDVFDLTPALAQINGSDTVTVTLDACDGWALDYAELTTSDEDVEVLPVGFTVLSLPEEVTDDSTDPPTLNGVVTGTLSYVDPITGTTIVITADDITLPDPDGLLLPSERVTYTPPPPLGEAEAFEGLVAFHFSLSDGLSSDDGFIFIDVGGEVPVEIDPCVAVGRSLGCEAGELAGAAGSGGEGASGESPRIRTLPFEQIDALIGPTLTVVVEGPGTVTSNPKRWVGDRLLGLVCTTDSVCGVKFPLGALVGLLARPDDDAEFAGWQGQCQGGDITAVPINGDTVCRAVFEGADKLKVSTGYRTVPTRE